MMAQVLALPKGALLVGDYQIDRVLGAGGFGITYLGRDLSLARAVAIKEYFPADSALRQAGAQVQFRSQGQKEDFNVGLRRFIDEARALARFDHRNIARVYRHFEANNTAYMVLQYEQGQHFKAWFSGLDRRPLQSELDSIVDQLLSALTILHAADYLHRDIAPDNIIIRPDGSPVLIDFGSARGELAARSQTISAIIKPGYSPVEQYSAQSSQQGPWTDIYALGATLYHAVMGQRPEDAPSRLSGTQITPARDASDGDYRPGFLAAIDHALSLSIEDRPQSVAAWREELFGPPMPPRVLAARAAQAVGHAPTPAKPPAAAAVPMGGGHADAPIPRPGPAPPQPAPAAPTPAPPKTPPVAARKQDVLTPDEPNVGPDDGTPGPGEARPKAGQTRKIQTQTTPELVWRPKPKPKPTPPLADGAGGATGADADTASPDGAGLMDQIAARADAMHSQASAASGPAIDLDGPRSAQSADAGASVGAGEIRPAQEIDVDTYGIPKPRRVIDGKASAAPGGGALDGIMAGLGAAGGRALGGLRHGAGDVGGALKGAGGRLADAVGHAGSEAQSGARDVGDAVGAWWARHQGAAQQRRALRAERRAAARAEREAAREERERARAARQEAARAAVLEAEESGSDDAGAPAHPAATRRISPAPGAAGPVAEKALRQRAGPSAPKTSLLTDLYEGWLRPVGVRIAALVHPIARRPQIRPVHVLQFAARAAAAVGIVTGFVTAPQWLPELERRTATLAAVQTAIRTTNVGLERALTGHRAPITAIAPLISGRADDARRTLGFVSADRNGVVYAWRYAADANGSTGRMVADPRPIGAVGSPVTALAASRLSVAVGRLSGDIEVLDAASAKVVRRFDKFDARISALAFVDGTSRVFAASPGERAKVFRTNNGRYRTLRRESEGIAVASAAASAPTLVAGTLQPSVQVWDMNRQRIRRTFFSHTKAVEAIAVSPDGRLVASGGQDREVNVWDPAASGTITRLGTHDGAVTALALSPDARFLASAGTDAKIKIWDLSTNTLRTTLQGHTAPIRALAYLRGGEQLVSGGDDQRLRLWNTVFVDEIGTAGSSSGRDARLERFRGEHPLDAAIGTLGALVAE